jgi:hypothetical protein
MKTRANHVLQRTLGPFRLSRVNGSSGPNAAEPGRSAADPMTGAMVNVLVSGAVVANRNDPLLLPAA